ncbi:MAG TPA: hypothetical protein VI321_05365 [Burkholderiales bacterium]
MKFFFPLSFVVALSAASLSGCAARNSAASTAPSAAPAAQDEGWQAFGHALTLAETLIGIAARSDDPQTNLKDLDDVLAGRNPKANSAIAGLLDDATSDMPAEYRDKVAAIGHDLTAIARRDIATQGASRPAQAPDRALQARKDLTAMGLSYYDPKQFLDAVKRDDELAAELYIDARGVNLSARDADGRSALDIARANGNTRLAQVLAKNLPAAR